jgi:hypothetical protein
MRFAAFGAIALGRVCVHERRRVTAWMRVTAWSARERVSTVPEAYSLERLVPRPVDTSAELMQLALPRPLGGAAQAGGASRGRWKIWVVEGTGMFRYIPSHSHHLNAVVFAVRAGVCVGMTVRWSGEKKPGLVSLAVQVQAIDPEREFDCRE